MGVPLPPPPPPPAPPVASSGPEHEQLHAGPIAPPPPPPAVGRSGSGGGHGRPRIPFTGQKKKKPAPAVVINTAAQKKPSRLEGLRDTLRQHARAASPGPELAKMDAPDEAASAGGKTYGKGPQVPFSKVRRARAANGVWQSYASGERGEASDAAAGVKGAMRSSGPGDDPAAEPDYEAVREKRAGQYQGVDEALKGLRGES